MYTIAFRLVFVVISPSSSMTNLQYCWSRSAWRLMTRRLCMAARHSVRCPPFNALINSACWFHHHHPPALCRGGVGNEMDDPLRIVLCVCLPLSLPIFFWVACYSLLMFPCPLPYFLSPLFSIVVLLTQASSIPPSPTTPTRQTLPGS